MKRVFFLVVITITVSFFVSGEQPQGAHPLDRFLGKWLLINHDTTIHERRYYLEVFIVGSEYRYNFKYGATDTGRLDFISMTQTHMLSDDADRSVRTIVGNPIEIGDSWGILIDNEGPLGYFKLEINQE